MHGLGQGENKDVMPQLLVKWTFNIYGIMIKKYYSLWPI